MMCIQPCGGGDGFRHASPWALGERKMDKNKLSSYFSEFDGMGESIVRSTIGSWSSHDGERAEAASEWCRLKEDARALASSAKRSEREEETLCIARRANRIAWIAISMTTILGIISILKETIVAVLK